jgi:hypothetical protein
VRECLRARSDQVIEDFDGLVAARYGRDGDILERGYGVTLLEAGYATGVMWWNEGSSLGAAEPGFQHGP